MADDGELLRAYLGESIAFGQQDADTMFFDHQIDDMISRAGGNLDAAAAEGWKFKAAEFANLVNVTEGSARRDMSDLHRQALAMQKHFQDLVDVVTSTDQGTTIGRIERPMGVS